MQSKLFFAGILGVAALATAVLAHSGATGVVKERMDGMKAMGQSMKTITPMMQGKVDYDPAVVREAGATIQAHSGEAMTSRFPEGSNPHPSEAKPEIWQDWAAFSALAERLEILGRGLEQAAANGLGPMHGEQGSMMGVGDSMGTAGMMGTGTMMGVQNMMSVDHVGQMPADTVFLMVGRTCTACHTRYRVE